MCSNRPSFVLAISFFLLKTMLIAFLAGGSVVRATEAGEAPPSDEKIAMEELIEELVSEAKYSYGFSPRVIDGHIWGDWKVVGYVGEPWIANPKHIIGRVQHLELGYAEGVFFDCPLTGQSIDYTEYAGGEFLQNKEFKRFREHQDQMHVDLEKGAKIYRISCDGAGKGPRSVLYPFVMFESSQKVAAYPFEGAIYILEK